MNATIRPSKSVALRLAAQLAPQYAAALQDLRINGSRLSLSHRLRTVLDALGSYVLLYEDESKLTLTMAWGLLGQEGFRDWQSEVAAVPVAEVAAYLDDLASSDLDSVIGQWQWPQTDADWELAKKACEALPEAERKELSTRASAFYGAFFCGFFNTLALIVHGAKLTRLVPLALSGDAPAFGKAIQTDRRLLTHHPYFRERKQKAQDAGDAKTLGEIAYREANPPLRGRIRYPGLYMLFAILEGMNWLDELPHSELLDLCDGAGLDAYENRIEDTNALTKRLRDYRRFQKAGGSSMH